MSYSFTARGASKMAALAAVVAKLEEVVAQQPIHSRDVAAATAAAEQLIFVLPDVDGKDVSVACNGYVSAAWTDASTPGPTTGVSFGISVNLVDAQPAAQPA